MATEYDIETDQISPTESVDTVAPVTDNLPVVRREQPQGQSRSPKLNIEAATKTLNFFAERPYWLANPKTKHAAEAMFKVSADVITKSLQLERLGNSTIAAQNAQLLLREQLKLATAVATANPEAIASYYVPDENGKMPISDLKNMAAIAALHKKFVKPTDSGQLEGVEVTMPDGSTVQAVRNTKGIGYTIVPKKDEQDRAIVEKETDSKASKLETDIRQLDQKFINANAAYKQALASDPKEKDSATTGLRAKAETFLKEKNKRIKELDALRKPAAAEPATPAAAPGKRVRVKGPSGQVGTVIEGEALPEGWSLE